SCWGVRGKPYWLGKPNWGGLPDGVGGFDEEDELCGCESGWTLYLEHSMYDHHPSHPYQNHNNNVDDCNGKKWSFSHENDFDADDEDMSMVSDASSGPPHCFQEQEDDQCFNNNGNGGVYTNVKRQKNIIPKEPKLHRKVQDLPCLLDDTASSPFYNFSNVSTFFFPF
ncbi:hypothetical protein Tco_1451028, partial [Tanacetum coccineum]